VIHRSRMNPSLGRNFEVMGPLEWLARLSDHIPDPGQHRTLFYGDYSNRVRGSAEPAMPEPPTAIVYRSPEPVPGLHPRDRAVQTPNTDTPYSWLGLDLRTEPMVLTVPKVRLYWPKPEALDGTWKQPR
jgi:hypothetical protein